MIMEIINYDLPTAYTKNTYKARTFTFPEGAAYDLTGATVTMTFKLPNKDTNALELKTPNGLIVQDARTLYMPAFLVNVSAANYDFNIHVVYANGRAKTYSKGVWIVENNN